MIVYIALLAFLASPGILAALLSKRVQLRKAFATTYTQVLVSSLVFGVLYAFLRARGLVREGFQSSSEFKQAPCGGPEGTKCKLEKTGANTLTNSFRYGECVTNTGNKPGFTCVDTLNTETATNWAGGKIVRYEPPKMVIVPPTQAEIDMANKRNAERAVQNAKDVETAKNTLNSVNVKKVMKGLVVQMRKVASYKNTKLDTSLQTIVQTVSNRVRTATGADAIAFNNALNALVVLNKNYQQAYFDTYINSL